MVPEAPDKQFANELDLGLKNIDFASKSLKPGLDARSGRLNPDEEQAIRAQGGVLRELQTFIKPKDPSFGGLRKVLNKRRQYLWVHEQFAAEY